MKFSTKAKWHTKDAETKYEMCFINSKLLSHTKSREQHEKHAAFTTIDYLPIREPTMATFYLSDQSPSYSSSLAVLYTLKPHWLITQAKELSTTTLHVGQIWRKLFTFCIFKMVTHVIPWHVLTSWDMTSKINLGRHVRDQPEHTVFETVFYTVQHDQ